MKKPDFSIENGTAIALGNFDGIHLGHQKVISRCIETGITPVVFFVNNKFSVLTKESTEQNVKYMGANPYFANFEEIVNLSPERFVRKILIENFNAKIVCCGYNFHFGKGGNSDVDCLRRICEENNIKLNVSEKVEFDGEKISSSLIRKALENGDIYGVNAMLGRNYSFTFSVFKGDQRGRTIGFPTINQALDSSMLPPKFGVYASVTVVDGVRYKSVTNIGIRPTFQVDVPQVETHILDFSSDVYGKKITVELVNYIRNEQKFSSLDELKKQIAIDKEIAKQENSL